MDPLRRCARRKTWKAVPISLPSISVTGVVLAACVVGGAQHVSTGTRRLLRHAAFSAVKAAGLEGGVEDYALVAVLDGDVDGAAPQMTSAGG